MSEGEKPYQFGISATVKLTASSHKEALEKLATTSEWEDWDIHDHTSPEEASVSD